ncbi:ribonuclease HII [Halococcus qingdaonensis]|uniref:ribonuclease HII n=1 Tax=Halococcus qingdaonensis TaxID=224402 RepID=UPI0021160ABA|nr:ribonuclease HII [Halococcus qingdaonensis]
MFGVDEAGRGPVLGSLFVACVSADATLPDGIDDSKRLAPARREALAAELRADEQVTIAVSEVTPTEIDDGSLNALTAAAMADTIDRATATGESGVVDACDTDAARFGRRVRAETATDVAITAEHGADESHEHVGAASIVAKVARDEHIADLAAEHGAIGSGYPGDSSTRSFLREYVREHGDLPPFARESWKTSRDVLEAADQSALADF